MTLANLTGTEYRQLVARIEGYVERAFQRSGRTAFPTVRQVARALRLRQGEVEDLVDDSDRLFLTSYFVAPPDPLGDHFVESYGEEKP